MSPPIRRDRRILCEPPIRRVPAIEPGNARLRVSRFLPVGIAWTLVIATFFFRVTLVDGRSMAKTLEHGDRLVVDTLSVRFDPPRRGEIVILNNCGEHYVKRLIAYSGEMVEIRHGFVYVDGRRLHEVDIATMDSIDYGPTVVPRDSAFVLGDNRAHSEDSRIWGPVPLDAIEGIAVLRVWPLTRFGSEGFEAYL